MHFKDSFQTSSDRIEIKKQTNWCFLIIILVSKFFYYDPLNGFFVPNDSEELGSWKKYFEKRSDRKSDNL